jgi:hypothetical protein
MENNVLDQERPSQQNSESAKVAQEVDEFVKNGKNLREKYESQWYINMAQFLGYQWTTWNGILQRLRKSMDVPGKRRIVINKIMPAVMKEMGRMLQNKPVFKVMPVTTNEDDKNKARVSEELLDYLDRKLKIPIRNQKLLMYLLIYGTAFKDILWDVNAGEERTEDMLDENGQPQQQTFNIGEVDIDILSPFQVIWQRGANSLEDSNRVCTLKLRSLDWIQEQFPDWGYLVKSEAYSSLSSVEQQNKVIMGEQKESTEGKLPGEQGESKSGFALVKTFRELPCKKYPQGRVIITANKILLYDGALPMQWMIKNKKFGLVRYTFLELGERFPGRTYVEDMIPPQVEYNRITSRIQDYINRFAGKWITAKGHKLSQSAINSETNEVVEYEAVPGASEPHMVAPPALPAYIGQQRENLYRDMQDISAQHEISKGNVPAGITAGVAISLLANQDLTQYAPVHSRFADCEAEAAHYILETVKEKYTEPRKITIMGENSEYMVKDFTAMDDMPTDIEVQKGSGMPSMKEAKQAQIMDLMKSPLFSPGYPPDMRKEALKLLEFGGLDEAIQDANPDEERALLENRRLTDGSMPVDVEMFDVHPIHIMTHDKLRKSVEYEKFTPEQKQMTDMHVARHMGVQAGVLQKTAQGWVEVPPPMPMPGMPGAMPPQAGQQPPPQQMPG